MPKKGQSELEHKPVLTTYDAARICKANIASIKNWIAKGLLRAYRTPGGHYRIKRADLEVFLSQFDMPNPFEDRIRKSVLMLDSDAPLREEVAGTVGRSHFQGFADAFDAGLFVGLERPDVIVIDLDDKQVNGQRFLEGLQRNETLRDVPLVHFGARVAAQGAAELRNDYNVVACVQKKAGIKALMEVLNSVA